MSKSLKAEFGSGAWLAHARRILGELATQRAGQLANPPVVACELFLDPPTHLAGSGQPLCWSFELGPHHSSVSRKRRDDADFKVISSYAAARSGALTLLSAPQLGAALQAAIAAGLAGPRGEGICGDPARLSPVLIELLCELHNRLAAVTA